MNALLYFLTGVLLSLSLSVCAAPTTLENQDWNGVLVNTFTSNNNQAVQV